MKKVASLVAAGALLLASAGAALAYSGHVHQWSHVTSVTTSSVSTGGNYQRGGGDQSLGTGDNASGALSATGGNVNLGGSNHSSVHQGTTVSSMTTSSVSTGGNKQKAWDEGSQSMYTGNNMSSSESLTVGNVNVSGF